MSLFDQAIESIARLIQAWYVIPLWEKPNGDGINAQSDADGNLNVSIAAAPVPITVVGEVEGVVADDAAVGATKPVVIGGVYYTDPTSNPIDDGDAGFLLLNEQRMAIVEDRAYDAPTAADRNVPVWNLGDRGTPETLDSTLGADGTVSKYVAMRGKLRWSLHFVPTAAAAEVIALTVLQSNDDVDDPTTATYIDVTNEFFGVGSFTAAAWIEPEFPTKCVWLKVLVTVTGWTAGTSAWKIQAHTGGQA